MAKSILVVSSSLLVALCAGSVFSMPPFQEWVAHYDGPANDDDIATAIAVDSWGNVYVTGQSVGVGSSSDYTTVKYDTNGTQVWEARYNGPGNGNDYARGIALDDAGNAYVTGYAYGGSANYDYVTIKYDTNGTPAWESHYNGPGNATDYANAIALDPYGNVYVTGYSVATGSNADVVTIKYDTDGNQQWVARYNGPANGHDLATAIAVDRLGNVYVTGQSIGGGSGYDYVTIKYDTDGALEWVARYNGPGNNNDYATAIAVNNAGNAYITGYSHGSDSDKDYLTIKYDTTGNQVWVARYNGPGNYADQAQDLCLDGSGNVYVTGLSVHLESASDYATIKYSGTDGTQLWIARYNGTGNDYDDARAIAIDDVGNLYVTGNSKGTDGSLDYATVKYTTNGDQLWVARYSAAPMSAEYASAIAVDRAGNVCVTGRSDKGSTNYDYTTIKYGQCEDLDQDGYGIPGSDFCQYTGDDCDDTDPAINPGALEGPSSDPTCSDGMDNDCDTFVDNLDTGCFRCVVPADCDDSNPCTDDDCVAGTCINTNNSAPCDDGDACTMNDVCSGGLCTGQPLDADHDGYVSQACGGNDCDDANPEVNPGSTEVPNNGLDDDCNPATPPYGTPASVLGTTYEYSSGVANTAVLFLPFAVVIALKVWAQRVTGAGHRGIGY